MRKRVRLSWQLESNTPTGVTARWLLQQNFKDHALEAVLAFWYPFALQSQDEAVDGVAPLTQAEALLAITRLERQIALLRHTFLPGLPIVPTLTVATSPVPAAPAAVSVPDPAAAPVTEPHGSLAISGFETFDTSLADGH